MDTFITWLNKRKSNGQSLWTNKTGNGRTNTYLQKLSP
jgi:hypothetical protein